MWPAPAFSRRVVVSIVDTCFLFDQAALIWRAAERPSPDARPHATPISRGPTRWFAPDRVAHELAVTSGTAASSRNVPQAAFERILRDELLPRVRFVTIPDSVPISDSRVAAVAAKDPDDVPCAQLAVLLAPCHLLSADKHHRNATLAPANPEALDELIIAAEAFGAGEAMTTTVGLIGGGVAIAVGGLVTKTAKNLGAPRWLVAIAVLGMTVVVAHSWLKRPGDRQTRARRVTHETLEAAASILGRGQAGYQTLKDAYVDNAACGRVERVAHVLARAHAPMTAAEIAAQLATMGDGTWSEAETTDLLEANPAFTEHEGSRWQLGRELGLFGNASGGEPIVRQAFS